MLQPRVRKSSRRWSTVWLLAPLIGTPMLLMVLLHPQVNERSRITTTGGSRSGSSSESSGGSSSSANNRSSGGGGAATPQLVATPPLVASTSTPPAVASGVQPRQDRSAQDHSAPPEDTGACSPLYDVKPDVDLPQGDLEPVPHRAASVSHCCELCEAQRDAGCTAVTFTPAGECWLKELATSLVGPTVQRGLISAVRRSSQPQPAESTDLPPRAGLPTAAASAAAASAAAASALVPRGDASVCSRDPEVGCMASPAVVVMTHNREELLRRCIAQLVGMRLSERFTLYVHEDSNSRQSLAVTRRAAAEAGQGRVAEVISSVARSGTGHAFERGGLHKVRVGLGLLGLGLGLGSNPNPSQGTRTRS